MFERPDHEQAQSLGKKPSRPDKGVGGASSPATELKHRDDIVRLILRDALAGRDWLNQHSVIMRAHNISREEIVDLMQEHTRASSAGNAGKTGSGLHINQSDMLADLPPTFSTKKTIPPKTPQVQAPIKAELDRVSNLRAQVLSALAIASLQGHRNSLAQRTMHRYEISQEELQAKINEILEQNKPLRNQIRTSETIPASQQSPIVDSAKTTTTDEFLAVKRKPFDPICPESGYKRVSSFEALCNVGGPTPAGGDSLFPDAGTDDNATSDGQAGELPPIPEFLMPPPTSKNSLGRAPDLPTNANQPPVKSPRAGPEQLDKQPESSTPSTFTKVLRPDQYPQLRSALPPVPGTALKAKEQNSQSPAEPSSEAPSGQRFSQHYAECFKREMLKVIVLRAQASEDWRVSCKRAMTMAGITEFEVEEALKTLG